MNTANGHYDQDVIVVTANIRTIPDESTGSSIVTVINSSDRIDANNATKTPTEHKSARDNCNRRSGTFEHSQQIDNNTNAIESSINKCIQATKSLSIQSNESPAASPPQSSTLNTIGVGDKNYMGSGTKYIRTKCKNQFLHEPSRILLLLQISDFFNYLFWPQNYR